MIIITAGHSNVAPGAVNKALGRTESQIVTEFRNLVAEQLTAAGVPFKTDGVSTTNQPLNTAAALIGKGDLAVEFHLNSFDKPTATGVETLSAPVHYPFCRKLVAAVAKCLGIANRGAKPENSGQHESLMFVRRGGIVLELFFLSNTSDLASYDKNKSELARVIANLLIEEHNSKL